MKQQQTEIATPIEQHQTGDDAFRTTLEALISVASRAVALFERSNAEQKRKLVSLVFSNLRLNGKRLDYTMRSPFDLMVNRSNHTSWQGFLDTVRTERFRDVLDLKAILNTSPKAA